MKKTVRGKLLLGTITAVLIINILFTIFISVFLHNSMKKNIIEEIQNSKRYAVITIKNNNVADIDKKTTLNAIKEATNSFVAMADEKGNVKDTVNIQIDNDTIKKILEESNNERSIIKFNNISRIYCVTYNYPIFIENKFYCNFILQKDYTARYKEKNNIITMIILAQLIVIATITIVISFIVKKVTDPMKELSVAMENYVQGKDNNISINTDDELEQLSQAYIIMKDKINKQMNEIITEKERVEELQKSSREFFNNATHELKTPLTSISLYAQLLRDEDISEMEEEVLNRATNRIVLESNKIKILVEKILEVSKGNICNNKALSKVSITKIVEGIIEDNEGYIEKNNLIVNSSIEEVYGYGVLEDIEQIISNLLDNAIKYCVGKDINIKLYNSNDNINFEISNKCGQIPKEIKHRLLEPFIKYNTFQDIRKEVSSSGLGLYLCSELAKENCGSLSYEIREGYIVFKLCLKKQV